MSDTPKHSPSPFKYDTIESNDENAYTYDVVLDANGDHLIGSCREIYNDLIVFNDADWHLFAAAPEMLEALKALCDLKRDCPCEIADEEYNAWGRAQAAIAKAEGRQE
jgi:hypothetical protein